jgi:hypothetical protein
MTVRVSDVIPGLDRVRGDDRAMNGIRSEEAA